MTAPDKKTRAKTLFIVIGFLILAGSGYIIGQKITWPLPDPESVSTTAQMESLSAAPAIAADTLLSATTASVGPLLETFRTSFEISGKTHAEAAIPKTVTPRPKTGNAVVFYDRNDPDAPYAGSVESIVETKDQILLTISLPEDVEPSTLSSETDIVLRESRIAKRLPLSALQMFESGDPYVWVADLQEDSSATVRKQAIQTGLKGRAFFEVGLNILGKTAILANPPPGLTEGQNIEIILEANTAPLRTAVQQAKLNRMAREREEAKRIRQEAFEERVAKLKIEGCGPLPQTAQAPQTDAAAGQKSCSCAPPETPENSPPAP